MNWWLNASFNTTKKDEQKLATAIKEDDGDAENLMEQNSFLIFQRTTPNFHINHSIKNFTHTKKILSRLKDSRFDFFNYETLKMPIQIKLHNLLNEWIGSDNKLSILDLSSF